MNDWGLFAVYSPSQALQWCWLRELREALMFRDLIVSRRTWEEVNSQCAVCVIDTCKRQSRASGASQPRTLVGWGRRLQERLLSGGGQG